MNKIGFKKIIDSAVGDIKVYSDFIPEQNKSFPAISYIHIANNRIRVLKGYVTAKEDTWRVSVVCEDLADCDTISKQLELLDNTSSNDFRNVLVMSINDEPEDPESGLVRLFVDFKTIDR